MFYSNKLFHIFPSFFLSSKSILLLVSCNSACHALLFKGSLYFILILEKLKFEFWDYTLRCISTLYFWRLYLKISLKKWWNKHDLKNLKVPISVSVLSPLYQSSVLYDSAHGENGCSVLSFAFSTALHNTKRHMLALACQSAPAAYKFGLYFWKET